VLGQALREVQGALTADIVLEDAVKLFLQSRRTGSDIYGLFVSSLQILLR
jgi:hypothetical protein